MAKINGVSSVCSVQALTWGMFCPWVVQMRVPDLIVGADILYDATQIDSVLATVSYFLVSDVTAGNWGHPCLCVPLTALKNICWSC